MTPEIESLYEEIGKLLGLGIREDAVKAWVYVEMSEATGVVSVYCRTPDGKVRPHRSGVQLDHALYGKFFELRNLWADEVGEPWTIASYSLELPTRFSIDFGYDDVSDVGAAMDRRTAWEKKQFGDAPVGVSKA